MTATCAKPDLHTTAELCWVHFCSCSGLLSAADSTGACAHSVGTVTEEVLATPRSSHDGTRTPRPSSSGPAVEHLAVQVCAIVLSSASRERSATRAAVRRSACIACMQLYAYAQRRNHLF